MTATRQLATAASHRFNSERHELFLEQLPESDRPATQPQQRQLSTTADHRQPSPARQESVANFNRRRHELFLRNQSQAENTTGGHTGASRSHHRLSSAVADFNSKRHGLYLQEQGVAKKTKKAKKLPTSKQMKLSFDDNVALRSQHLPKSLRCHYENTAAGPLKLASGLGQYLYDDEGRQYLDCVNNVCHVGHCHPRVVQAAVHQLGMLNTNSRYLHDNIVRLAEEVTSMMPDPLSVAFFVNSGTEATELALRLARNHTQRQLVYCVDGAYHGNSAASLAISPYNKYSSDAQGDSADAIKLMMPDVYQNQLTPAEMTSEAAAQYSHHLKDPSKAPAAFIVESMMCCGGQIQLPEGYLRAMTAHTRKHGGVTIADEVQTGFGRIGSHMWAFEAHGVVPDIVTLGKPFGNGFPLSAVITSKAVAKSSEMLEYFNTFGGESSVPHANHSRLANVYILWVNSSLILTVGCW
jgi:4-aminobutyrate aminotransferase-like enzyme